MWPMLPQQKTNRCTTMSRVMSGVMSGVMGGVMGRLCTWAHSRQQLPLPSGFVPNAGTGHGRVTGGTARSERGRKQMGRRRCNAKLDPVPSFARASELGRLLAQMHGWIAAVQSLMERLSRH